MDYSKKYKVRMHYSKVGAPKGTPWSLHFKDKCHIVSTIHCKVPMLSEYKPNKKDNPRAFFTAMAADVIFDYTDEEIVATII